MYSVTGIGDCGHTETGKLSRPHGDLPQFWKIHEKDCVIRITIKRDLKYLPTGERNSAVSPALGDLQVETDPLAIDQDRSRVNQLLSRTVVAFVAA